jgi:hypothetical protein
MTGEKSQSVERRDAECAEGKISKGNGGDVVDKSQPMLAWIILFVKYYYSTSI